MQQRDDWGARALMRLGGKRVSSEELCSVAHLPLDHPDGAPYADAAKRGLLRFGWILAGLTSVGIVAMTVAAIIILLP